MHMTVTIGHGIKSERRDLTPGKEPTSKPDLYFQLCSENRQVDPVLRKRKFPWTLKRAGPLGGNFIFWVDQLNPRSIRISIQHLTAPAVHQSIGARKHRNMY